MISPFRAVLAKFDRVTHYVPDMPGDYSLIIPPYEDRAGIYSFWDTWVDHRYVVRGVLSWGSRLGNL